MTANDADRRRLLILSFSPIASDARVLKQVTLFAPDYDVITCGYGERPDGVVEHIRIPDDRRADDLNGRLITLRMYRAAYNALSGVRADVVLANDVETVPMALELHPRYGVHADLHEYSPRLHEEFPEWKRRIKPYYDWLCRRYVSKASSWSTVSHGLADEYRREFGFQPVIVTNAAPYAELEPGLVRSPIRLVHSGASLRNRNLMAMIEGVAASDADVTLDLYLMGNDPGYREELRERGAQTGRVTVREPVPYRELIDTLNRYDVGVHILPPTNFNNAWALPNKLFDYVQARLGVIVGPSAEMRSYVERNDLGVVADDFTPEAFARVLDGLTQEGVEGFKRSANASAHALSAEEQVRIWADAVRALMDGGDA